MMNTVVEKIRGLRNRSFFDILKKLFATYIYRTEWMMEYALYAKDVRFSAKKPFPFAIEILDKTQFSRVLGSTPHFNENDFKEFVKWDTLCVVAKHENEIISSLWLIRGKPYLRELKCRIEIGKNEYLVCRAFSKSRFRGKRIAGFLLNHFAKNHARPDERFRSFIYHWNVASIHASEHFGFKYVRDIGFTMLYGIRWLRFKQRPVTDEK